MGKDEKQSGSFSGYVRHGFLQYLSETGGVQQIPEEYPCSITKFKYVQTVKEPVVSTTMGFLPLCRISTSFKLGTLN